MQFDNAYGCAVCAPARASLLTGYHDCLAGKWSYTKAGIYEDISTGRHSYDEIRELINNTSYNERPDEVFLPHIAKQAGLITGQIGKLEWGFATTPERLEKHGWDYHYGWYDHKRCHGFYPPFLFENGVMFEIPGNEHANCGEGYIGETLEKRREFENRGGRVVYSQDLFNQKIEQFIHKHKDEPFFLYHPSQLPHGPIAVPELHPCVRDIEELTLYEKEYASMVLRFDDTVGMIYELLSELDILESTVVIFASDNGHESNYYIQEGRNSGKHKTLDGRRIDNIDLNFNSEITGDIFNGNDGMSGSKLCSLDGGVRIPFIVRYPGSPRAGEKCNHLLANYDTMVTMADMLKVDYPEWKDGLSFLPSLTGGKQDEPKYVACAGWLGPALITPDGWKVRYINCVRRIQLFYLPDDYREENDLSDKEPQKLHEMATLLLKACDSNPYHGTIHDHKTMRVDELLEGCGPEEAFPAIPRGRKGRAS